MKNGFSSSTNVGEAAAWSPLSTPTSAQSPKLCREMSIFFYKTLRKFITNWHSFPCHITTAAVVGVPSKCAGQVSVGSAAWPHQQLANKYELKTTQLPDVGEVTISKLESANPTSTYYFS